MSNYKDAARLLNYNSSTGIFTWKVSRGKSVAGSTAGYEKKNSSGKSYLKITTGRKSFFLHRLAFVLMGEPLPEQVDHDNGNGMDNRRRNLSPSSSSENSKNRRLQKNNSSGILGVIKRSDNNRYRVRIGTGKSRIDLGHFSDFFDACCARKSAENKYGYHRNHGEVRAL